MKPGVKFDPNYTYSSEESKRNAFARQMNPNRNDKMMRYHYRKMVEDSEYRKRWNEYHRKYNAKRNAEIKKRMEEDPEFANRIREERRAKVNARLKRMSVTEKKMKSRISYIRRLLNSDAVCDQKKRKSLEKELAHLVSVRENRRVRRHENNLKSKMRKFSVEKKVYDYTVNRMRRLANSESISEGKKTWCLENSEYNRNRHRFQRKISYFLSHGYIDEAGKTILEYNSFKRSMA